MNYLYLLAFLFTEEVDQFDQEWNQKSQNLPKSKLRIPRSTLTDTSVPTQVRTASNIGIQRVNANAGLISPTTPSGVQIEEVLDEDEEVEVEIAQQWR